MGYLQPTISLVESDSNGAARKAESEKKLWCSKYSIPPFAEAYSADMHRRNYNYFARYGKVAAHKIDYHLPRNQDIEKLRTYLLHLEKEAIKASKAYKEKWDIATKRGTESIKSTVENWETTLKVAQFTRDVSTEFLIVGSVALGPLGAIAVKSGANILKGFATWQDTGNIGAGVITAGVGIVTAIIPAPKNASSKIEGFALLLLEKKTEFIGKTTVGVVQGKSLKESAALATVDMVGSKILGKASEKIAGKFMPSLANEVFNKALNENTPIPVKILKATVGPASGALTNMASAQLINLAKNDKSIKKPLPQAKISGGFLVDYAIIGPDGSHARFAL